MKLFDIQKLAKTDVKTAEKKLLVFVQKIFPGLYIEKIRIDQKSYSLNSVFGYIAIDNKEYFFKFHSEEGEEKTLKEYYNSCLLSKKGFPIIIPVYKSTRPGKQFLIYEKIKDSNVFDILDKMDRTYLKTKTYNQKLKTKILKNEKAFDKQIIQASLKTLKIASRQIVAKEEINQLFYRRFVSPATTSRFDLFYKNKTIALPGNKTMDFEKFKKLKWNINGIGFKQSINDCIDQAKQFLNPLRLIQYPVITGHGDDHNGNKFFTKNGFVYFDPAFAGENQYALLTFVKTTFHDTFAHPLWLYNTKDFKVDIDYVILNGTISVKTNYDLKTWAPIREDLLWIKIKNLWVPLLKILQEKNLLENQWEEYLRTALFSCPFLVYNLIDSKIFSSINSLFALSQCITVGSKSENGPMEKYFDYLRCLIRHPELVSGSIKKGDAKINSA